MNTSRRIPGGATGRRKRRCSSSGRRPSPRRWGDEARQPPRFELSLPAKGHVREFVRAERSRLKGGCSQDWLPHNYAPAAWDDSLTLRFALRRIVTVSSRPSTLSIRSSSRPAARKPISYAVFCLKETKGENRASAVRSSKVAKV